MKSFYGVERREVGGLELVIAGAGAAGLSAALYASLLDINYLAFEAEAGGGLMNLAKTVENMPGVAGKRGPEITESLLAQLRAAGGSVRMHEPITAVEVRRPGERMVVRTFRGTYEPRALIVATGLELLGLKTELGLAGERKLLGRGVSYCAECDGPLFRNKTVMVVGSPFDAFLLKRLSNNVAYLGPVPEEYRNQVPREIIEANDIRYLEGEIEALVGEDHLRAVVLNGEQFPVEGLFLTKRSAATELYASIGIELDDQGFIRVDRHGATNLEGVFAAGDVTGEPWQISKSIGEGAVAALNVFKYLTGQEMRNLGWALEDEWER